jgi:hypothetical protein
MKKNNTLTGILVCLIVSVSLIPVGYYMYYQDQVIKEQVVQKYPLIDFTVQRELKAGEKFSVKSVKVIDGNSFYLDLDGGYRIKALVPLVIKDESAAFVVESLQKATDPSVLLKGLYKGEIWIVDFDFVLNGKPTRLDVLLRENGFIFE